MNIKAFADEIRKQNRQYGEGSIRVLVALFGVYLLKEMLRGGIVYTGMKLFTALLYEVSFHRMYLAVIEAVSLWEQNVGNDSGHAAGSHMFSHKYVKKQNVRKYLDRVVRPHTFPYREYFSYIRKRQIAGQAAMVIMGIVIAVMRTDAVEGIVAATTGIVPTVVSFTEQRLFAHRISSRTVWGEEAALGIWRVLLSGAHYLICFGSIFSTCFLGYAFLSDAIAPDFADELVIYRVYRGHLLVVCALAFTVFLCAYLLGAGRKQRIITGILFAATFLMMLTGEHFSYIDTCPDKIVVSGFSGKKEYALDEITEFVMYPEDEMFQTKVTFADGQEGKLFGGGVSTSTQSWDELYFSEYDYMAELVPLLLENGAQGEIREVEEMRRNAAELDTQIQEALEQMIGVLGESNEKPGLD